MIRSREVINRVFFPKGLISLHAVEAVQEVVKDLLLGLGSLLELLGLGNVVQVGNVLSRGVAVVTLALALSAPVTLFLKVLLCGILLRVPTEKAVLQAARVVEEARARAGSQGQRQSKGQSNRSGA